MKEVFLTSDDCLCRVISGEDERVDEIVGQYVLMGETVTKENILKENLVAFKGKK